MTTSVPHNLQTGRVVTITSSNSIQSIDGIHQIVVTGPSTFSVALAVTVPGTAGSISVENDDFLDVQSSYNSLMDAMNNDIGVAFSFLFIYCTLELYNYIDIYGYRYIVI